MNGKGDAIPAEMLPLRMAFHGVEFKLGDASTGMANAIVARGQTITLPAGSYNRVYLLAASFDGDQTGEFRAGTKAASLTIQDWSGFVGQWGHTSSGRESPTTSGPISAHHAVWPDVDVTEREFRAPSPRYPEDYLGMREGYIKPAELAWYASHHHTAKGLNQPYAFSYLFGYSIELPPNAHTLTLPKNDKIRILAVSVAEENPTVLPAQPLFDMLRHTAPPAGQLLASH